MSTLAGTAALDSWRGRAVAQSPGWPDQARLEAVTAELAALPPLVGVIAFLFLYGESGLVTRVVQRALGMAEAPWRLKGIGAQCALAPQKILRYTSLWESVRVKE